MHRIETLSRHLTQEPAVSTALVAPVSCAARVEKEEVNAGEPPGPVSSLPLPPIAQQSGIFPTFPEMLADSKKLGTGIYSYKIMGDRRMTVIQDPDIYEVVFSPHDMGMTRFVGDKVRVEMDKLAHAWFQIPLDISKHTNSSLLQVRRRIGPKAVDDIADKVGKGVKEQFDQLGQSGVIDLVKIAHATFWPVNQAMYGESTIGPALTPGADEWFHEFDEHIPEVTGGMPLAMFEQSAEAAAKIVAMFEAAIEKDEHLNEASCPVMHARLAADDINKKYSKRKQAQFMLSLFWAPQANTLPMTWWVLAEILKNPRVKANVLKEVRETSAFKNAPDAKGHYAVEDEDLPYLRACMYEVFRMYIANLTHRKIAEDFPLKVHGVWYRIPAKDMMTVASYVRHWDPEVFPQPEEFRPERWLGEKKPGTGDFLPFAHGRYSCSGKFLAMAEIPILVGLFFRDFDVELMDPVPPASWENVVASVRPEGWPHNTNCRVSYTRRR